MIKFNKKAFLVALRNRTWNYAIKVHEDENAAQWTIYLGTEIMKSSNNNQNQGFSDLQLQQLGQLIDVKLQPMNTRLDNIEVRLDKIEVRIDHVEVRLDHVEEQQKEIKSDIKQINYRLDRIENCPTIKKELDL